MNLRNGNLQRMLIAFSLAAGIASAAAPAAPEPGRYVSGGGSLTIQRAAVNRTTFELTVVSPWNGHTCGPMEGEIREGRARVADGDAESACMVTFSAGGDGIDVGSEGEACSEQCGAAVAFEGHYAAVPPECDTPGLSKTRRQFQSAYDAKDFAKALSLLQPVLPKCERVLDGTDAASLRNDMAITQYHLHDAAGCLRTLEPLREDADKSDGELESSYPPFALELRLPAIRAARTNLKRCRASQAP